MFSKNMLWNTRIQGICYSITKRGFFISFNFFNLICNFFFQKEDNMRGIYSNWTAPIIPGEHGTNADLTANNLPRFSTLDQWTQKAQKSSTLWNSPLAQHAPLNHLKQTHTFSSTRFGNYSPPQETTTAPFR